MKLKRTPLLGGVTAIAAAVAIAVVALTSAAGATASVKTVKTGHALGKTVLVNRAGMTLYSLSAETHGRFICTGPCLSEWHPLLVHKGQKPSGAHSLGTVKRPTGQIQVTYKGKPLYTFGEDKKPGDAKGEGFKDVGVWHAASVGAAAKQAPTSNSQPMSPTYGGGYGGSGY
jgi:predicted lipoprotein with Yx(FWY)xxD motif